MMQSLLIYLHPTIFPPSTQQRGHVFKHTNNMWVLSPLPCDWLLPHNGLYWSLIVNARQQLLHRRFWLNQGAAEQTLCGLFGRVIKSLLTWGTEQNRLRGATVRIRNSSGENESLPIQVRRSHTCCTVLAIWFKGTALCESLHVGNFCSENSPPVFYIVLERRWEWVIKRPRNQTLLLQQSQSERRAETQTCVKCFPWRRTTRANTLLSVLRRCATLCCFLTWFQSSDVSGNLAYLSFTG